MPHPRHILVVSCLVRNRQQAILAVKHHKRGWELPQGRVEEGENVLTALHREVLEETGVVVTAPRLAAVWSKLTPPAAVIHGFVADYASGLLTPSAETPEVAWLSEGQALSRFEHPVNGDRLADLLAFKGDVNFFSYTTGPYSRSAKEPSLVTLDTTPLSFQL